MLTIDLSGKTALITGASQGLGEATARRLHEAGAAVAINFFNDPEGVNRRKAEAVVASLGERALAVEADVRDPAAVEAMVDATLARFGRLDFLINNAAIIADRSMKKITHEEWARVIDVNLNGVFNVTKAAVEKLAEGGRIVNMSSVTAIVGFFGTINYSTAKAGVIGMTKVLARELAKRRINVNAIAPGVFLTDMGKSIPEEVRAEMVKNVPLGRWGEPAELANVILFLCSDLSSYITGQVIHVNGGWIG